MVKTLKEHIRFCQNIKLTEDEVFDCIQLAKKEVEKTIYQEMREISDNFDDETEVEMELNNVVAAYDYKAEYNICFAHEKEKKIESKKDDYWEKHIVPVIPTTAAGIHSARLIPYWTSHSKNPRASLPGEHFSPEAARKQQLKNDFKFAIKRYGRYKDYQEHTSSHSAEKERAILNTLAKLIQKKTTGYPSFKTINALHKLTFLNINPYSRVKSYIDRLYSKTCYAHSEAAHALRNIAKTQNQQSIKSATDILHKIENGNYVNQELESEGWYQELRTFELKNRSSATISEFLSENNSRHLQVQAC